MAEIRGLVFHSRFDYIRKNLDLATRKKFSENLSDPARQLVFDQVFMVNNYPFKFLKELDDVLPSFFSISKEKLFREIGQDFATLITDRYFFNYVEAKQPVKFLTQFQTLYPKLWNFGKFEVKAEENYKVNIAFSYDEEIYYAYQWFIEGFLIACLEICGAKNIILKRTSHNSSTEDLQEYTVTWK